MFVSHNVRISNHKDIAFFSLSALSFILIFSGCAGDKSLTDYRNDQAKQNTAVYQSAAGDSAGTATLKSDGSVIGTAKLTLTATQVPQTSSDGLSQETRSTLSGSLVIAGLKNAQVSFSDAFFDPNAHSIVMTTTVTEATSGTVKKMHMNGTLNNGVFDGDIYFEGDEVNTVHIHTQVGAAVPTATVQATGGRAKKLSITASDYSGKLPQPANSPLGSYTATISLRFVEPQVTATDELYELLSTQRSVNVIVTENLTAGGDKFTINFSGILDERTNSLSLTSKTTAGNLVRLQCQTEQLPSSLTGWRCQFIESDTTPTFDLLPVTSN
jgi:hypothetical protein